MARAARDETFLFHRVRTMAGGALLVPACEQGRSRYGFAGDVTADAGLWGFFLGLVARMAGGTARVRAVRYFLRRMTAETRRRRYGLRGVRLMTRRAGDAAMRCQMLGGRRAFGGMAGRARPGRRLGLAKRMAVHAVGRTIRSRFEVHRARCARVTRKTIDAGEDGRAVVVEVVACAAAYACAEVQPVPRALADRVPGLGNVGRRQGARGLALKRLAPLRRLYGRSILARARREGEHHRHTLRTSIDAELHRSGPWHIRQGASVRGSRLEVQPGGCTVPPTPPTR